MGDSKCCKHCGVEVPQLRRGYCSRDYKRVMAHGSPERVRGDGLSPYELVEFHGWDVDNSGCWSFRGSKRKGYGRVSDRGRSVVATRVVWEHVHQQPLPPGQVVMHTCDNPPCVNPQHLVAGTPKENAVDMISKGRFTPPRGIRNGSSKLKEPEVIAIRSQYDEGRKRSEIAEEFGVSLPLVYAIGARTRWRHLEEGMEYDENYKKGHV